MKNNKTIKRAKSLANVERNRAKRIARAAKTNATRSRAGFIGFLPGLPLVPVLDLLGLGGPERVRALSTLRHDAPGGRAARAVEFHNHVASAFAAAEGKA